MRALAFTFRNAEADQGSIVTVTVTGGAGGSWFVERQSNGWLQIDGLPRPAAATVTMDQDTAWKLVTKRRSWKQALEQFPTIRIEGDQRLGQHALEMVSVMA
jgi:hypothetical protein